MADGARVLIVEDDEIIRGSLARALRAHHYQVSVADSLVAARRAIDVDGCPDLLLLDLGLPDGDGTELCTEIHRSTPSLPIVVLTARSDEVDIVVALRSGAVDYVLKPFRLAELLARIESHLRTRSLASARPGPDGEHVPDELVFGKLTLSQRAHRVLIDGVEVALRPREFALLARLVSVAGDVVAREQLIEDVWDEHWWGSTKTLDVHVNALRRKLGFPSGEQGPITTIRGIGYRFDADRC